MRNPEEFAEFVAVIKIFDGEEYLHNEMVEADTYKECEEEAKAYCACFKTGYQGIFKIYQK